MPMSVHVVQQSVHDRTTRRAAKYPWVAGHVSIAHELTHNITNSVHSRHYACRQVPSPFGGAHRCTNKTVQTGIVPVFCLPTDLPLLTQQNLLIVLVLGPTVTGVELTCKPLATTLISCLSFLSNLRSPGRCNFPFKPYVIAQPVLSSPDSCNAGISASTKISVTHMSHGS